MAATGDEGDLVPTSANPESLFLFSSNRLKKLARRLVLLSELTIAANSLA